jgi:hypothetical protein
MLKEATTNRITNFFVLMVVFYITAINMMIYISI